MKEVKCPSGAVLKIGLSPFSVAKALYQATLKEVRDVKISSKDEMVQLYKDVFCVAFGSEEIERCLSECFKRCTYNNGKTGDLKIDDQTFEPVSAREDYITVCVEVAIENVYPFMKSLYAEYLRITSITQSIQA